MSRRRTEEHFDKFYDLKLSQRNVELGWLHQALSSQLQLFPSVGRRGGSVRQFGWLPFGRRGPVQALDDAPLL